MFISMAGFMPNYAAQALLDRALVQMVLFFPLAILGGLGLAGLIRHWVSSISCRKYTTNGCNGLFLYLSLELSF